ncbi:conserved hypothetical protein [delta proteobacterium NaphS2]|nr:conserved hypothetical protein [delta proteobacterium NaphS2]
MKKGLRPETSNAIFREFKWFSGFLVQPEITDFSPNLTNNLTT